MSDSVVINVISPQTNTISISDTGENIYLNPLTLNQGIINHSVTHQSGGSDQLLHNLLGGLQGGSGSNYYHLTSGEYANLVTGLVVRPSETGVFITSSQTGAFYAASNASGFVTGSVVRPSETGVFITSSQTGAFYASSNPSGFVTGSVLRPNETANIPAINGGTIANGSITVQGTTDSTRTTSNTILEPSGGGVIVGASTRDASAIFQIDSTTSGFLLPRMTIAQRNAIATPATGLIVYTSDDSSLNLSNGSSWANILTTRPSSFTSANLASALTDENGTGSNVFSDNATLSSPTINTALTLNATTYTYTSAAAIGHLAGLGTRRARLSSNLAVPSGSVTVNALTLPVVSGNAYKLHLHLFNSGTAGCTVNGQIACSFNITNANLFYRRAGFETTNSVQVASPWAGFGYFSNTGATTQAGIMEGYFTAASSGNFGFVFGSTGGTGAILFANSFVELTEIF